MEVERDEPWDAPNDVYAVDESYIRGVGDDDLIPDFYGGEQHVQNAGQPARGNDAIPRPNVVHARQTGNVPRHDVTKVVLAGKGQIAVVHILRCRLARALDGQRIGHDVDVQIFESEQI